MTNNISGFTGVTAQDISSFDIQRLLPSGEFDADTTLTSTTQFSESGYSSYSWGSFSDNEGQIDDYYLYFFFEATSLNATASTYELITGDSGYCSVDSTIYQMLDGTTPTNFYAIRLIIPERYDGTSQDHEDEYSCEVNILTNDDDVKLTETITVSHEFCVQITQG